MRLIYKLGPGSRMPNEPSAVRRQLNQRWHLKCNTRYGEPSLGWVNSSPVPPTSSQPSFYHYYCSSLSSHHTVLHFTTVLLFFESTYFKLNLPFVVSSVKCVHTKAFYTLSCWQDCWLSSTTSLLSSLSRQILENNIKPDATLFLTMFHNESHLVEYQCKNLEQFYSVIRNNFATLIMFRGVRHSHLCCFYL